MSLEIVRREDDGWEIDRPRDRGDRREVDNPRHDHEVWELKQTERGPPPVWRFFCPGCGKRSGANAPGVWVNELVKIETEGKGRYCPRCDAFVHDRCMLKKSYRILFTVCFCPVCKTELLRKI